jgi:hypothetical protein
MKEIMQTHQAFENACMLQEQFQRLLEKLKKSMQRADQELEKLDEEGDKLREVNKRDSSQPQP